MAPEAAEAPEPARPMAHSVTAADRRIFTGVLRVIFGSLAGLLALYLMWAAIAKP